MKSIALLILGAAGALMLDGEEPRAQQLGALFITTSIFSLLDLKGGV